MKVYVARAIRGVKDNNSDLVFKTIKQAIKTAGHQPQFEIPIPPDYKAKMTPDRYIYMRDIFWLDESNAMVAEVSNPSTGVGYEIAYARHAIGLPTLCVAQKGSSVSAMITGSYDVAYYDSPDELAKSIDAFLKLVELGV